jgi:glycosyltransferase involved in cell wall biosynthesis
MKVAIVCDWLTETGGAERVIKAVHELFPEAPIYTSQYRRQRAKGFEDCTVKTGWLNFLPAKVRRLVPFFRNLYFSRLNLSHYDLVISIVNAEAKAVKTGPDSLHIAYLQGPPTQYYWGLYDDYIKNPGFGKLNFLARWGLKLLVKPLRRADWRDAQKADYLLANSAYVAAEIKKYYGRQAEVLWPPVAVKSLQKLIKLGLPAKRSGFITAGRQVNWKRIDLAIKACHKLGQKLLVIGDGPEHQRLVELAKGSHQIKFLPSYNNAADIVQHFNSAKAFIFPSLEPFGITPIEALACGTPVVAFKRGGAQDFIKDGQNGLFFNQQTVGSLAKALKKLNHLTFDNQAIMKTAAAFDEANFKSRLLSIIKQYQSQNRRHG